MKKILIISSSPRKNGNSDALAHEFEKGAKESGNQVEFVRLAEKKINYCIGCYACRNLGKCFQQDDMNELAQKLTMVDVIVFATPVYFYSMSGQLKVFIDRLVQNYTNIHADVYIFVTAWDSNEKNLKNAVESVRGLTRDCLENCTEKGVIMAGGVPNIGDIKNKQEMQSAYNMGKNC